jgi:hypothetical protein
MCLADGRREREDLPPTARLLSVAIGAWLTCRDFVVVCPLRSVDSALRNHLPQQAIEYAGTFIP